MLPTGPEIVPDRPLASLQQDLHALIDRLPDLEHSALVASALESLLEVSDRPADRLDWKILSGTLADMQRAIALFWPHRHQRKVTVFGSARTQSDRPEYAIARQFAAGMAARGFLVVTGAGGGIMEAANQGAGPDQSFGLNIQLPFEQSTNPFITDPAKLMSFKYFFTRKLFLLRESDAVALLPGGLGTQDEVFECLTLMQTGKYGPAPLVLLDRPGGSYWQDWEAYQRQHLLAAGLISADDCKLYHLSEGVEEACATITDFYRLYHSSRYVGDRLVIRLRAEISAEDLASLNEEYSDLLSGGKIETTTALPPEQASPTRHLPRLVLSFNQKNFGRLHQMIWRINRFRVACELDGPECK